MYYKSIIETIGNTPMVELANLSPKSGVRIFAKLEGQNPTGSVKDRIVKYMLDRAQSEGRLTRDRIILEPTSGNTGIAMAMIGRLMGYRVKVVMPENVSQERRKLLDTYGAEIILSDSKRGTNGSIQVAQELARNDEIYFLPHQYENLSNPLSHYETTAPEIIRDLPDIDAFIAGLGTGGTLTGAGRRLKEHNPEIKVIAVVPHPDELIQGLRSLEDGYIPPVLDQSVLNGRMIIQSNEAVLATRELTEREGIFAGISSGAVLACAQRVASRMQSGNIVCLLADGGWKYLSTELWTKDLYEIERNLKGKIWW
ncbi:MAG: cysteine synthase family protein [Chloroflexi bacterium]|nr:cysteine synthase family protein [Chloroflexota bacterium]MCI0769264.1 cysteine synthase family protein [Chloroflexota bacterium]